MREQIGVCDRPRTGRPTDLRLCEHVDEPAAHGPVGAAGDEIVGVLGSDDLHGVYGVGVSGGRERGLEDRKMLGPCVPEQDLSRVRATKDEVGVKGRTGDGEHVRLGVKDEFGTVEEMEVPDGDDAVGFVERGRVLVVGRDAELGVLW